MTPVRRPLLVGALVAAVIALVASAAVAIGTGNGGSFPAAADSYPTPRVLRRVFRALW